MKNGSPVVILSGDDASALAGVCRDFGLEKAWLFKLINFESRWKATKYNSNKTAAGLLQFYHTNFPWDGYDTLEELISDNPDRVTQLQGPVRAYLEQYAPINSFEDLCAVVFYPANRNSLDETLPSKVRNANPGITTVSDYVEKVRNTYCIYTDVETGGYSLLLLALLGFGAYKLVTYNPKELKHE